MEIEAFRDIHVIEDELESRFREFDYCIPMVEPDGFFLEFGVWKAKSINYMASLKPENHFYGFDTFEGVAEEWVYTDQKNVNMKKFSCDGRLPDVLPNVTLVKGLFQETLPDWKEQVLKDQKISFINADADLYSSTKYFLSELNENIVTGTIIRFDEISDWRYLKYGTGKKSKNRYTKWQEGEWKALNEWIQEYDREVQPLWRSNQYSAGVKVVR